MLKKKGFKIIDRNFRKKFGELDVVALNKSKILFIEVKTVSRENIEMLNAEKALLDIKPEESITRNKIKRLKRAIESFLLEKKISRETDWNFSAVSILISQNNQKAYIKFIKDIVLI